MITCIKGGVSTVKFIIHQLLLSLFNSNMNYINNDNVDLDCLHLLDDVFIHKSQLDVLKSNKHDKQLLIGVLLIARQLCSEDNRLTGINYKQWWMETFCNPLLSTHNNNNTQNVLSSRCAVVYFCDLLIELLPWETDPKFLQIQVNTRPNWFNLVKRSMNNNNRIKIHPDKIRVKPTEVIVSFNEDELIIPIDLECTNMITDSNNHNHNTYIESCINRWNDYCEIAQGRLAELREHCCATKMVTTDKKISDCPDAYTTPGWSDVLNWLNEIATQRTVDYCTGDISKCRLPSEWNEVNLFRPRWLRSTLIPALLNAPEIEHLSAELKFAREQLLQGIRSAGLSHLLNHTEKKTSTTKTTTKATTTTTTNRKQKRPTCITQRSSTSKQYRMSNKSVLYNQTKKS
ncbi:hypothetical protein MS3_00008282 [Schistosoma haematobium]|nr:hypothetical protein MS3_00008282 [Schistosoma haematobium]KAH9581023.1 hypothetical protein MS3_00008282 [Schistosoma haematobium]